MPALSVFTTKADLSVHLFSSPKIQETWDVKVFLYEEYVHGEPLPDLARNYTYLRDPFNASLSPNEALPLLETLLQKKDGIHYIDNLSHVEDIFLEDKWLQYQLFPDFMPRSHLPSHDKSIQSTLYKKRISSRARGISFTQPETNLGDYIVQERLDIEEEYRVVQVCDLILPDVLVKSSKTEKRGVKVQKAVPLPQDVRTFTELIQKNHRFDLVGYDIARVKNGDLFLIEMNRSPQIVAYARETSINLFEILLRSLSEKMPK